MHFRNVALTLLMSLCSALMVFLFIYALAQADDIYLESSSPVKSDPGIIVATYMRNESNYYYFTVAYKFFPKFTKFKTELTFNITEAAFAHDRMKNWIREVVKKKRIIFEEPLEICPIDPNMLPRRAENEV